MEFLNNQIFETIELEAYNDWLHVKLNRPKSKNALSNAMITELINLISLAKSQQFLRGIFLSGKEGSFCSGADLKEFQSFFSSGKPKKNEIISSSLNVAKLLKSFYHFSKYVIACIDGPAYAGGFGLACCSDFIFATKKSKFGITEIKIGLTPAQIAPYVINRLGRKNAKNLMLSGEVFDAERALHLGLLDKVFGNEQDMVSFAKNFSNNLKPCAPNAVAITKSIVSDLDNSSNFSERAADKFAECMLGDETPEGLQAFIEKRKPRWNL